MLDARRTEVARAGVLALALSGCTAALAAESPGRAMPFIVGTVRNEAQAVKFVDLVAKNERRIIKLRVSLPQFEDGVASVEDGPGFELLLYGNRAERWGSTDYNSGLFASDIPPGKDGTFLLDGFFEVSEGFRRRSHGVHSLSRLTGAKERAYRGKQIRRVAIGD